MKFQKKKHQSTNIIIEYLLFCSNYFFFSNFIRYALQLIALTKLILYYSRGFVKIRNKIFCLLIVMFALMREKIKFNHFCKYFELIGFIPQRSIISYVSGPDFWGLVDKKWQMCSKGKMQSPINIDPSTLLYDPNLSPVHVDKSTVS